MSKSAVHPGAIDWSGDNPGMFLRESPDGPFVTLLVWFRVCLSEFGAGHVLLLFEEPNQSNTFPDVANICAADNKPLAEYLVDNFCKKFGAFRGAKAFETLPVTPMISMEEGFLGEDCYGVEVKTSDAQVVLRWEQLGDRFAADVPPDKSATGKHEMYSCFVEAHRGTVEVNGRRLRGEAFPRDFLGRATSSAFLAFSETWIRA